MIRPTLRAVLLFAAGIPLAVLVIVLNAEFWPLVLGYVALACDLWGERKQISSLPEVMPMLGALASNPPALRARVQRPLEALKAHKVSVARKLEEEHILQSTDRLIEMLRARGLWQDEERTA